MPTLTITLHWQDIAGPRQANVVCEDSPPEALLPLLIAGCGLPAYDAQGQALRYGLRTARPGRPVLNPTRPLSVQNIHDGAQLWLVATDGAASPPEPLEATRCLLRLPEESGEVVVPVRGLTLDRDWLLRAFELLDPTTYVREMELLERRRSALIYVSSRPHCRIGRAANGAWLVTTERRDVLTLLNDMPLSVGSQRALADGDRLRIGDAGPLLTIALV